MEKNLAKMIDHTVLKAETTKEQIVTVCEEAKQHNFYSVCINPTWVKEAASLLSDSEVKVCTVIGFPLGATTSEVKAFETKNAIENGAGEIDMVINIGKLKDGDVDFVKEDIRKVVEAAKEKALVKVIIETCLLTDDEKEIACKLAVEAGADYVKTSTGFSTGGATVHDIKLMRKTVGPDIGVKASGGVRDREAVLAMIEAGATRIGASSGVAIVSGEVGSSDY
ncbi:deoxyribose-phosphate aldolase [Oceanobacillus bengalensis]|uniref:Deoxyribose-phosphate aldolase n=1 Tax=Oceanobacillus bengalensis TaxID=1435466 RepID=A0A494Z425_9BACI|nr:deoxyribose-phosphate aldolase [Oceanobacillus bengalensis]RKQ17286.1 deoxyribose-phosphate aldolase [Oceanobacillus bengalensis]